MSKSRSFSKLKPAEALPLSPSASSPSQKHAALTKTPVRASHAPSPLSFPENNSVVNDQHSFKSPTSPLPPSPLTSVSARPPPQLPTFPIDRPAPQHVIRQVKSSMTLNEAHLSSLRGRPSISKNSNSNDTAPFPSPTSSPHRSFSVGNVSGPSKTMTIDSSHQAMPSPTRRSADLIPSQQPRAQPAPVVTPSVSNSPPLLRNSSLRSKLSLPNLRGKNVGRARQEDVSNFTSQSNEFSVDSETMQVRDMGFELVRPVLSQMSPTRTSEDSASLDTKSEFTGGRLRADSPAYSMSSIGASSQRSPTVSDGSWPKSMKASDSETSMDAHRQRELKWVSVMSSVPASQARRNKKVKKLLLDGVPSSVRFLVWAHLADSKAKAVSGVYSQLSQRAKIPAYLNIERDIQNCFADQPQLQSTQGSLLSFLQAYLTMVPDIQYQTGNVIVFRVRWSL
jgi:hypothetical protein